MPVGVCTNATTLDDQQISALARIGGVHCNVSLDGFRPESHGRFRGDRDSFAVTVATVRALAAAGLLQGLLCTPNSLAEDSEYRELCEFAAENGADYVLMNPLSSMGRGVKARGRLAATEERMQHIYELTAPFQDAAWTSCISGSPAPAPAAGGLPGRNDHLRLHPRRGDRLPVPGVRRPDPAVPARPGRVHRRQHLHRPGHRGPAGRLPLRATVPDGRQPHLPVLRHAGHAARAAPRRSSPPGSGSARWTPRSARSPPGSGGCCR